MEEESHFEQHEGKYVYFWDFFIRFSFTNEVILVLWIMEPQLCLL